jgi:hypothetical protein
LVGRGTYNHQLMRTLFQIVNQQVWTNTRTVFTRSHIMWLPQAHSFTPIAPLYVLDGALAYFCDGLDQDLRASHVRACIGDAIDDCPQLGVDGRSCADQSLGLVLSWRWHGD